MNLHTFNNVDDYAREAALTIEQFVLNQLENQKVVRIALSGGSSPLPVYEALAETKIPWSRVCLFLVDERYVPLNSKDSNARLIQETIIDRVSNLRRFYAFNTRKPISTIVDQYQKTLQDQKGAPLFDLVLLGLGSDGHTASLFPGIAELHEENRLVVHTKSPDINTQDRLSLTFPAIFDSQKIIFLIRGASKESMVNQWLNKEASIDDLPAKKIFDYQNEWIVFYDKSS